MKLKYLLPILLLIVAIIATVAVSNMNNSVTGVLGMSDDITIKAQIPETSSSVPYYKVVSEENENEQKSGLMKVRESLPSEKEAVAIADQYLRDKGSFPEDASISNIETITMQERDTSSGEGVVVGEYPLFVEVSYDRHINGMPVVGPGDSITVSLGDDGEVIYYAKYWRKLEQVGNVEVISGDKAIEKLNRGETIVQEAGYGGSIEINNIELGYFSNGAGDEQEFYEPVWIFRGVDSYGYNVTKVVKGVAE
jgi:regulatory protein YycI of two-component signal transduction system YycFG